MFEAYKVKLICKRRQEGTVVVSQHSKVSDVRVKQQSKLPWETPFENSNGTDFAVACLNGGAGGARQTLASKKRNAHRRRIDPKSTGTGTPGTRY